MTLLELAERVEKATEPDRELDLLLWEAVEPVAFSYAYHQELGMTSKAKPQNEQARIARNRTQTRAPKFTFSLDAAMTLVPEGCAFDLRRLKNGAARAVVWRTVTLPEPTFEHHCKGASSAALALTAACLRARHGQQS